MKRLRPAERERRRAEDRFREEYHDAHAKTVKGSSTFDSDGKVEHVGTQAQTTVISGNRVRIRITKTPPAMFMDGFDVRGFQAGHVYDVDNRTGAYLQIAGYGVALHQEDNCVQTAPHAASAGKVGPA